MLPDGGWVGDDDGNFLCQKLKRKRVKAPFVSPNPFRQERSQERSLASQRWQTSSRSRVRSTHRTSASGKPLPPGAPQYTCK